MSLKKIDKTITHPLNEQQFFSQDTSLICELVSEWILMLCHEYLQKMRNLLRCMPAVNLMASSVHMVFELFIILSTSLFIQGKL